MKPQPYEIWLVVAPLGLSRDLRPCVVLPPPSTTELIPVFPISSSDLGRLGGADFFFNPDHPDFGATGLSKRSFALGGQVQSFPETDFLKMKGRVEGNLLREFRKWVE